MTTSRYSRWKNLGVPAALLVLVLIYGWGAVGVTAQFDEGLAGPKFLPVLLTSIVTLALLRIMHKEWRNAMVMPAPAAQLPGHGKPALVIAAIIVYIAAFRLLGYPLATLLLAFALLSLFEYGKSDVVRRLVAAASITGVFYVLFMVCFSVRLPLMPGLGS